MFFFGGGGNSTSDCQNNYTLGLYKQVNMLRIYPGKLLRIGDINTILGIYTKHLVYV